MKKVKLLAAVAVLAMLMGSCSKDRELTVFWQYSSAPKEGVMYHDTLQIPSLYYRIDAMLDQNGKEGDWDYEGMSVKCTVQAEDYEGNAWDEVLVYFDNRLISTLKIPFEETLLDIGGCDWKSDHTLSLDVYTRNRTDCYPTKIDFWNDAERDTWSHYR